METPKEVITHEKRKGLVLLGIISLGLILFGAGFYLAGNEINDAVTWQAGIIMAFMGIIGLFIYIWARKHPMKPPPRKSRHSAQR